jgi:TyrR family helix-turn-helix protein
MTSADAPPSDNLPSLVVNHQNNIVTSSDPIAAALAQNDFNAGLDLLEREMLMRLYPDYPSSRKLAERLGVSHTSIANKLRKYGIGQ